MPYDLSIEEAVVMYPLPPGVEYVVYRITCVWGEKKYICDHRYSEFRRFHKGMKKVGCGERDCRYKEAYLPRRMLTQKGNHSPGSIRRRREALEGYLKVLGGRGLCRDHERCLHKFIDFKNGSSVMQGSEELTFAPEKRLDKSFWSVELERPELYSAYAGLSIQLLDTSIFKVQMEAGVPKIFVNSHSSPESPLTDIREKVYQVTKIFHTAFTPTAFPRAAKVFSIIGKPSPVVTAVPSPTHSTDSKRCRKTKSPHPLHSLEGSPHMATNFPPSIVGLFKGVWAGGVSQVVKAPAEVTTHPIAGYLLPRVYPQVPQGVVMVKPVAMQCCRDILSWVTSCKCETALSLCSGNDPYPLLQHITECTAFTPDPVSTAPHITIQNTDFTAPVAHRRGSLESSCGMSSEGPSTPTSQADSFSSVKDRQVEKAYLSVKASDRGEACLKTIRRAARRNKFA
eukprot:TRINITY_DN17187_c1_g1_i1.p1 TRINITY_DN17187_c1_g1~~TRINITY_DN17187_c1_g1_i1.p1  ORF type:complete len:472 (+),score=72.66 TRINITY_DN17187_c1_g1_i1:57-1418(+)